VSLVALQGGSGCDAVLGTVQSVEDFEQEIVDQYALAMAAAGLSDGHTRGTRAIIIEFARSVTGPLWEATCEDADGSWPSRGSWATP
jgi:integrase/recombinase XerC